jgi:hypothetical protein
MESTSLFLLQIEALQGFRDSADKVDKRSGHRLSMILRFRRDENHARGGLQLRIQDVQRMRRA